MTIKHTNDNKRGFFVSLEEDQEAGRMTYTWAGADKLIIDHTEINAEFKGKGIGKLLLMELVDFARKSKVKVIPLCPFAKSVFDKMPEIRDVLL